MDLEKAKKLLNKINALYDGMESDPDSIATIEKDLMRSYVRQFYEHFLEASPVVPTAKPNKKKAAVPKAAPKPPPPPKPAAPVYEPPRVIELSDEVQEFVEEAKEVSVPTPPPVIVPKPRTTPPPSVQKTAVRPTPPPVIEADEEILELFTEKKATDLSEKLSSMPVTDLLKTMGLNERILTVNELFGGDANAFKKVMTDLNALSSFDEAKAYLSSNVVSKYGWTKRNKKSKAKVLIKTIRRRYA